MTWFSQLSIRRTHVFIALAVFLALWRIPYYGKYALDDPFITFRYADNLVKHGQFVFNQGEYVLATTTPVYALLMAGVDAVGLPIPTAATILNLGFEIALLYVLGLIIAEFKLSRWAEALAYGMAGLLIITNRAMSVVSQSGMETPLFVLLNMLTLFYTLRRAYIPATVAGSLATLTRPDGIFALVAMGIYILVQERRLPLREVAIGVLIGLPWVIVASLTYGTFIPHSVIAKDASAPIWAMPPILKAQILLYDLLRVFFLFMLPPLLWAAWKLARPPYRAKGWLLLFFAALQVGYTFLPNNLGFEWYFVPLYTVLDLFTGIGLALLLFQPPGRLPVRLVLGLTCGMALVVGIGFTSAENYLTMNRRNQIMWEGQMPAIDYLKQNAAPGSLIQTESIGMLGFYTDFRVLDAVGLASPEVLPLISHMENTTQLYVAEAKQFAPDFILTNIPTTYEGYDKVAEFWSGDIPYVIYRRTGKPATGSAPKQ